MPKNEAERLESQAGTTLSQAAYGRIHADILDATLAPGQRLRTRELCDRYGVGLSPLREALNRLASEGMVVQAAHRGFAVADFSVADLNEIVRTKKWLNEIGLRESIAHGDAAWEESVVLAFHRLSRTPRVTEGETQLAHRNVDWNAVHLAFHTSLISGCRSAWLVGFCEKLFFASDRYRSVARLVVNKDSREEEHRRIMEATVNRDADLAVSLLNAHFDRTADLVRSKIET